MDHTDRHLALAIAAGITVSVVRWTVFPHARWWNLIMAALLLVVLAVYLRRERRSP